MGVRFPSVQSNTFIGPLPASAVETVVLTTPPLTIPLDFATIFLLWDAEINGGTSTTAFGYSIRRGTTVAGPLVQASGRFVTAVVGSARTCSGVAFDVPGAVAGQQYSLTVVQQGAAAAGVWNDGYLIAFAL